LLLWLCLSVCPCAICGPDLKPFGQHQVDQRTAQLGDNERRRIAGRNACERIGEGPGNGDPWVRERSRGGKPVRGAPIQAN